MDIARLRALRELSLRQTMAAVAEALHLTPSAVSQQIAQLEEEAGLALVERRGRGVRLTPAGARLVEHAETVLAVLDAARADLARMKAEVAGVLRIAAFPSVAGAVLPQALKAVAALHPRLELVLHEMEPAEGLAALNVGQIDAAVVDDLSVSLGARRSGIETVALGEDRLHVLLPARHRLARQASVGMPALRDEHWALDSSSSLYSDFVVELCRRAGYEPRVNAACRSFEVVSAMVAAGCSVSLIPALRSIAPRSGLVTRPLKPEVRRRILLAHRRGQREHPAIEAMLRALRPAMAARR